MRGRTWLTLLLAGALALFLASCASEQPAEIVNDAADVAVEPAPLTPESPVVEEPAAATDEPEPSDINESLVIEPPPVIAPGPGQCETYETIAVVHTSWVESKEADKSTYDDDKLHIMCSSRNTKRTYYYFEVPAHPGSLVSAEFVIDIEDRGDQGQVAVYSTNWDGAPVSWNSGPPQGAYLDHKSYTGGPCGFDVSSAVTGPGPVSFLGKIFDESSPDQHADHYDPQLVITYNICADPEVEQSETP